MVFLIYFLMLLFGPGTVTTDPLILKKLQESPTADIVCVLKSPWIDPGQLTASLNSKEAKGQFMYSHLHTYAEQSQKNILTYLRLHHIEYRSFYIINAIHIPSASASVLRYLQSDPAVLRLEFNSTYKLIQPRADIMSAAHPEVRSPLAVEWGIHKIGADSLWALGIKGKGAVVGSEDTGVELHPALKPGYRGTLSNNLLDHNYNWHDAIHSINPLNNDNVPGAFNNPCGLDTMGPCDDLNHGTLTTGVMSSTDLQTGVAPEAQWIGCRCMERGWGMLSTYIECFEWFLAPTDLNGKNPNPSKSPHVINNSWGCPPEEGCNPANFETMEQVIKALKAAGIFVAVSAGNDGALGCSSISDPAGMFASSFSIGATAINDSLASFSSRGPILADQSRRIKPDLTAPGVSVRSTIRNNAYGSFNGTSLSSPHVSGAVALLISAFPSLAGKVELIEDILKQSAVKIFDRASCGDDGPTTIPNNLYGYGRLDVYQAYLMAKNLLTTGVKNPVAQGRIKTYPNPGDQAVTLELADPHDGRFITVYDIQGKIYLQQECPDPVCLLNTTQWRAGLYFYRILGDASSLSGKLIIQH